MSCVSAYGLARGMKVVRLTGLVRAAVPALYITSLPRNAIGFSFEGGVFGALCGALLLVASMLIAFVLSRAVGLLAFPFSMWLIGGSSVLMIYNSAASSLAFVKPLCSGCRLRPIIEEHEAIHLRGVVQDGLVWREMKKRGYSTESLSLDGDPRICTFCPIPKRLKDD